MKAACINFKMLYCVPEIDVIDVPLALMGCSKREMGITRYLMCHLSFQWILVAC